MYIEKEFKIVTAVALAALVITNIILAAALEEPFLVCLTVSLAIAALYVTSVLSLRLVYRRVRSIRLSAKKLVDAGELSDGGGLVLPEKEDDLSSDRNSEEYYAELDIIKDTMTIEGEFGKLSEAVYDLYTSILEAAVREKKQKLYLKDTTSDISHQLKTPIASLMLFTDILAERAEAEQRSDSEKDILKREQDQLEKMRWLTISLLGLARVETNAVEFKKVKTPAKVLLKDAEADFIHLAEKKNVVLSVEGDDADIMVDPDWLHEALSNVVKNAVEHSPEGGRVILRCSVTPLMVKLSVTDEGRGIPEADRLKVFERFSHSSDASALNPDSIGIGLPMAKSIVEGNGGRMYIESRFIDECGKSETSYTTINLLFDIFS